MPKRCNRELPVIDFVSHEPDRAIGFEAGTFDYIELPASGWVHRHTFYQIIYVVSGEARHTIDSTTYRVRPATLYLLRPDQAHAWDYQTAPTGYLIAFDEEFFQLRGVASEAMTDLKLFNRLSQTPEIPVAAPYVDQIQSVINDLIAEYHAAAVGYWSVLQAYMHILLARILRMRPAAAGCVAEGRPEILARQFTDLLMRRQLREQSVRAYSDALGVTPGHLAETVKHVIGRRPSELIHNAQVVEAKRLLTYTDMTVSQVGFELGFTDSAYFGRFFKRETGATPGDFRRLARAENAVTTVLPGVVR